MYIKCQHYEKSYHGVITQQNNLLELIGSHPVYSTPDGMAHRVRVLFQFCMSAVLRHNAPVFCLPR
jgi:hypothetical protein